MISTLFDKINVWDIVSGHYATLKDARTAKFSPYDTALFFAVPLVPVGVMLWFDVRLTDTTVAVLATALSILAGLLFNLLVLLHTLNPPSKGEPHDTFVKKLTTEVHFNIAYAIVVALVALLPLVIASYFGPLDWRRTAMGDAAVYLTVHFSFTMGMVLKRMDTLLQQRLPC